MSIIASELPSTITKPPKTRTKLPIYIVSAIVIVLAIAVLVINLLHRSSDTDDDDEKSKISVLPTKYPVLTNESSTVILTTVSATTTSSESSSSEEEQKRNESLIQVTIPTSTENSVTSVSTDSIQNTTETPISTTEAREEITSTSASPSSTISPTSFPVISSSSSNPIVLIEHTTETTETDASTTISPNQCDQTCSVSVVESIPRGVHFHERVETKNAYESWIELLESAKSEIDIFAFKMNLRGKELRYDVDNSTFEGAQIYRTLVGQANSGIVIKVIDCQPPTLPQNDYDANELEKLGLIERRGLDMNKLNGGGGGIAHSKAFIVDDRHLFVGSPNFEWKSFSQKLEIGLQFYNCPCIAADAARLFDQIFKSLSGLEKLESVEFKQHRIGNSTFQFLASPSFLLKSPDSWDLSKLLNVIYEADEFIDIAVMQYFPSWIYFKNSEFFSQIDNAIRMTLSRGVKIRMLVSGDQKEEEELMFSYLHSLEVLGSPKGNRKIQVKYIMIPQSAQESYKDRKMHAKFILSETSTLIGSSNYAPEYFYKSSGTSVLVEEEPHFGVINKQMKAVFERYWNSHYTLPLMKFGESRGLVPKPRNPFTNFFGFDRIGFYNEKYSNTKVLFGSDVEKEEQKELEDVIYI